MIHVEPGSLLTIQLWDPAPSPLLEVTPDYVDEFWVPAISSLAVAAARLLGRIGERSGGFGEVTVEDFELGIGLPGTGTHAPLILDQLEQAGLVRRTRSGRLLVRSSFPRLAPHLVVGLAPRLASAHRGWLEARGEEEPEPERVVVEPSARMYELVEAVEDLLTRPDLGPLQAAYRWQAVVRVAEDARDEALLDWAAPDLESTLAECQLAGQSASDAVWSVQIAVAVQGTLPDPHRLTLSSAAAGLIDWMVAEFPTIEEGHPLGRPDAVPPPEAVPPSDAVGALDPLDRSDS